MRLFVYDWVDLDVEPQQSGTVDSAKQGAKEFQKLGGPVETSVVQLNVRDSDRVSPIV